MNAIMVAAAAAAGKRPDSKPYTSTHFIGSLAPPSAARRAIATATRPAPPRGPRGAATTKAEMKKESHGDATTRVRVQCADAISPLFWHGAGGRDFRCPRAAAAAAAMR